MDRGPEVGIHPYRTAPHPGAPTGAAAPTVARYPASVQEQPGADGPELATPVGTERLVALSFDELVAIEAALALAIETLGRTLVAVGELEASDGPLTNAIGTALEALATSVGDVRRASDRARRVSSSG